LVSDSLNVKLNLMTANITSEMRKENDRMRQEFSTQLQTEVKSIAKELEVVRKSTDMEITVCETLRVCVME
jgi:hypothetical protein